MTYDRSDKRHTAAGSAIVAYNDDNGRDEDAYDDDYLDGDSLDSSKGYSHGSRTPTNGYKDRFKSLRRATSRSSIMSTMGRMKGNFTMNNVKKNADKKKLNFVVTFFFLACAGLIIGAHFVYYRHLGEIRLFGQLKLEEAHRRMFLYDSEDELVIESRLGVTFPGEVHPYPCIDPEDPHRHSHHGGHKEGDNQRCLEWKNLARLDITHRVVDDGDIDCYRQVNAIILLYPRR